MIQFLMQEDGCNMDDAPKILILSRGFRAGDAITTLNLFSQWPKENLYCASLVETEYSKNVSDFYLLGDREIKYRFPFNYIYKPLPSHRGPYLVKNEGNTKETSILKRIYDNIVRPIMQRLDLYETRFSISLSKEFETWLEQIKPEAIYTSIGDIPMAEFLIKIHERCPKIKILIHGFDDWFSPAYRLINGNKHRNVSVSLFKEILSFSTGFFTSSEKMASDYKAQFGYHFTCFPNPVKVDPPLKIEHKHTYDNIVFTGKIGWHNQSAISDMMKVVEKINSHNTKKIYFDIYTDITPNELKCFIGTIPTSTRIHKSIPNQEIPNLLASASAVFLPISTDKQTTRFTRYSMSTKMGEYLASGVPMIYYGPEGIAMTEFLQKEKCCETIINESLNTLYDVVLKTISDPDPDMIKKAWIIADKNFNINTIGPRFSSHIQSLLK